MNHLPVDSLFEQAMTYPDADSRERLARLVGLDDQIKRLSKMLGVLVNSTGLDAWVKKYHPGALAIVDFIQRRPPLIVLAGDVGSGKTELAETIGDAVARQERIDVNLFPLSLAARGQGRVGEMTQLLSAAFEHTVTEAKKRAGKNGKTRGAVILLVDEADALAQSREASQMHHEDRAGVNAFIRGVDKLAKSKLPAAVIMCTNRLNALDPAIRRRSADILAFSRPDEIQRRAVLEKPLRNLGFGDTHINEIIARTGERGDRPLGMTYSDLTQRFLPALVLYAYPHHAVNPEDAIRIAEQLDPTPPFQDHHL